MLFLVDKQGVPSVATWVQVGHEGEASKTGSGMSGMPGMSGMSGMPGM